MLGEQRVVWRVPARLAFPHVGRVGTVGTVEVDVTTGVMDSTPECKAEIQRCVEELAAKLPPYQPKTHVPEGFLPRHVPAAPKLIVDKDGMVVAEDTANRER